MAPEQHEGKAPDARSDVFSLGIILHELVTGNRPQPGDDPRDHFSNPPDWLDVWEECFTHRDKRYENAGKIVADLDWFDFNDYGGKAENKANGWTAEEIEREARAATEPTSGQVLSSVFLWVLAAVHIVPALVFLMSGQIVGLPIAMAAIYAAVSGWTVMSLGAKKREKWIESNLNILPGETRRDKLAWLVSREIPRVSQAAGNLLSQENDFFVTDASQVALRDSSEYYSRVKNTTRTIVPAETEPAVESMQEEQPGSDNPLLELKYGIIPRTWFKEEFNKRINKNVVALECANEKKSYLFEPEIETPELLTEPEVLSEIDLIKEEIDEVETEEIVIPKRAVLDDVIAGLQGTTTVNGGEIFISAGDWIEDEKVVEME